MTRPPLGAAVETGDRAALEHLLDALDDVARAGAAAWLTDSAPWFRDQAAALLRARPRTAPWTRHPAHLLRWTEALCAVTLLPPDEAARRVPWPLLQDDESGAAQSFVRRLERADPTWLSTFLVAAVPRLNGAPIDVLRLMVPFRSGHPEFEDAWSRDVVARHTQRDVDVLLADPAAGDALVHAAGSGRLGQFRLQLTNADVRDLADRGVADRDLLLQECLVTLADDSPPSHQRVLGALLASLGLRPDDVTGGFDQAHGLVADRHAAVAVAALPVALDLAAGPDDLLRLASAVGTRPERRLRVLLLKLVTAPEQVARLGASAAADAVRTMAEHDDDAAFLAAAGAATERLGGTTPAGRTPVAAPSPWDQPPTPSGGRRPPVVPTALPTWTALLRRGRNVRVLEEDWVVDESLRAVAAGRFDPDVFAAGIRGLLVRGDLVLPRLTSMLEVLFERGGLAAAYSPALALADVAAEQRTTGLHGLLRLLARYARPDAGAPGPHLLELAVDDGPGSTSKAALEARELVARLGAEPTPAVTGPGEPVGLWSIGLDPAPGDVALTGGDPADLVTLAARVGDDGELRYRWLSMNAFDGAWPRPGVLLADVVAAVATHGAAPVREALRDVAIEQLPGSGPRWHHPSPGPVAAAVQLWAVGALTLSTYPRLWTARLEDRTDAARAPDSALWDERGRRPPLLRLDRSLLSADPVLPQVLGSPPTRLLLQHACETLLLAPGRSAPLSTPTRLDGTVALDDVLDRLPLGPVGPLDLLLALHRLCPWSDAAAARLGAVDPHLLTDPSVSGRAPLPVAEVLRRWVDGGGLPPVRSVAVPGRNGPEWEHEADPAPVSWSETDVAPVDVLASPNPTFSAGAYLRVAPGRPDAAVARVHDPHPVSPQDLAALLTLHGHGHAGVDWLVSALFGSDHRRDEIVAVVAARATPERVDPELLRTVVREHLDLGLVTPARATPVLRSLFQHGGLPTWWPVALTVAAAGCSASRVPSGLADLLSLLADTVVEVPDRRLPGPVHDLAARSGKSRARVEAARLVETAARLSS